MHLQMLAQMKNIKEAIKSHEVQLVELTLVKRRTKNEPRLAVP